MVERTPSILVRLSVSMVLEGKRAERTRVNRQLEAERTFTTPASVWARAAW